MAVATAVVVVVRGGLRVMVGVSLLFILFRETEQGAGKV